VRILFLVHKPNRALQFESVILTLAEQGHAVCIATRPTRGQVYLPEALEHPLVSVAECPNHRADAWRDLVRPLRLARDYVRYFDPRFADAAYLLRHAERNAIKGAAGFKRFCDRRPWARRRWRLLERALGVAEDIVPSDAVAESFIRAHWPDVILVTPLIEFGSYQTDYVKAAHALGRPSALLAFSWDNLTVKGLVRVIPDRVLVWNEIQRREAVKLHGVPPERVVVTGAPRFDAFFTMRPSTARDAFCARAGLDPARPFLLYLCSASFVTRQGEVDFVRRWLAELRTASDPALRTCGVLVRPHPNFTEQWEGVEIADPNVAVWQQPPTVNAVYGADQGLYDSLHHAATAVGLNTTAMVQAGILGKAVHTILIPEFAGQEGTLHFEYLLRANGGLVRAARDGQTHLGQLAAALANPAAGREQARCFVEAFVRPRGLDVPATPIMVAEIERLTTLRKRPERPPLWHYPARIALRRWLESRGVAGWAMRRADGTGKGGGRGYRLVAERMRQVYATIVAMGPRRP
jgi:hypothetical protein